MTKKILPASVLGFLAGVVFLTPVETSARAGGGFAARSTGAHVAPRALIARPAARMQMPLPNRAAHIPVHAPASAPGKAPEVRVSHVPLRHQRVFGFGLPVTWLGGAAFYGTTYDPADDFGPYEVPYKPPYPAVIGYPPVPDANLLPAEPRQCRAQVVTVPKTNGGQQTVTIVRC